VACVEQGRWHYEAQPDFAPSADLAYGRLRSRNHAAKIRSLRTSGTRDVDQGEVWADIAVKHDETGSMSATGAMRDAFDHRRSELDEIKGGLAAPEPGQTGVIACIGGRPVALDAFDRPETLSKLWPRLLGGYALDALGREPATFESGAIGSFLASAAEGAATSHEGLGLGMDVVLTSPSIVGNALTWDEGIVHLAVFARADDGSDRSHRAARIEAPSRRRSNRNLH
jgi:predicted transcriptional regulator